MSTVSLLEPSPPYHEFSKHSLPSPAEAQVSALYDPRWTEIFLGSLKDRESYNEAKKKLQAADRGRGHTAHQSTDEPSGGQKGKAREARPREVVRSRSPTSSRRVGQGERRQGRSFSFAGPLEPKPLFFTFAVSVQDRSAL